MNNGIARPSGPVLVVGATGRLGGHVVTNLLARGKEVRALVRPGKDVTNLQRRGVQIARGDMLDPASLRAAMADVSAVVSTAAGFPQSGRSARRIDGEGNTNLVDAAREVGVPKFVLTSILSCDRTPGVPHFWAKKLAEDRLEESGVPFVALRPGALADSVMTNGGNAFESGRILWLGKTHVPLTFVLTTDLAIYLAEAVDADTADAERVDIGWDRPVDITEIATLLSNAMTRSMRVMAIPSPITRSAGRLLGPLSPTIEDMAAMFAWMDTGNYVADTTRQHDLFGEPPTAEDAIQRLASDSR